MTNRVGKVITGTLNRANPHDAGQDVLSANTIIIPAGESRLLSTGLRVSIPVGHVGFLKSRSGLSVNYSLEVGAGVIDCGYTGEVKVHLYNHGLNDYKVNTGDKIAQLITIPINLEDFIPVPLDALREATSRGDSGFGSTGI